MAILSLGRPSALLRLGAEENLTCFSLLAAHPTPFRPPFLGLCGAPARQFPPSDSLPRGASGCQGGTNGEVAATTHPYLLPTSWHGPRIYLSGSQPGWSPRSRPSDFSVFVPFWEDVHALTCRLAPSPGYRVPQTTPPPTQQKPIPCVPHLLPVSGADAGVQWLPKRGRAPLWAAGKAGHREPGEGLCQPANRTPPRMQPQRLPHRLWPRLQNKSLASAQKLGWGWKGREHSSWSPGPPRLGSALLGL